MRVAFAFTDEGTAASVAPDTGTTDGDGRVSFQVVMGRRVGPGRRGAPGRRRRLPWPRRSPFMAVSADANELRAVGGDEQSAPAGTLLSEPLVVQVTDAFGNPIQGVPIAWNADGGGSVSAAATPTGADGLASVVRTLGTAAGVQHALASSPGLAGSPVTFTHTASAGAAHPPGGGVGQRAVGRRRNGAAPTRSSSAPGTRAATRGGSRGRVGGGRRRRKPRPADQSHRQDGLASTRWTLGAAPGANGATAVVSGVGTVGFTATGVPGTPPGLSLDTGAADDRGARRRAEPASRDPAAGARRPTPPRRRGRRERLGAGGRGDAERDAPPRHRRRPAASSSAIWRLLGVPGTYTLAFSATGYTGVTSPSIALVRGAHHDSLRSDDPDPSLAGAPVRVRYQVESAGGSPTGLVAGLVRRRPELLRHASPPASAA